MAQTEPSLADAEAYVLDFVRARRERYSAAHILSEFHIPADAWPSDPEALTLAALASLVLCWVRGNADARLYRAPGPRRGEEAAPQRLDATADPPRFRPALRGAHRGVAGRPADARHLR